MHDLKQRLGGGVAFIVALIVRICTDGTTGKSTSDLLFYLSDKTSQRNVQRRLAADEHGKGKIIHTLINPEIRLHRGDALKMRPNVCNRYLSTR